MAELISRGRCQIQLRTYSELECSTSSFLMRRSSATSAPRVEDDVLTETAELRILRRYLAYALAVLHRDDDVAARTAEENAFAAACSTNMRSALITLYETPDAYADARAQWSCGTSGSMTFPRIRTFRSQCRACAWTPWRTWLPRSCLLIRSPGVRIARRTT